MFAMLAATTSCNVNKTNDKIKVRSLVPQNDYWLIPRFFQFRRPPFTVQADIA